MLGDYFRCPKTEVLCTSNSKLLEILKIFLHFELYVNNK